ncbi:MAG: M1 family metallopeptidase [Bacteroidetes bacterium]|nr:M1 family metallopeptidase [Bacteroidota bacterium]
MKLNLLLSIACITGVFTIASAQPDRWQQKVNYEMEIDFDVSVHQFTGTQKLIYKNNSPDTLHKVFYHLYFNAFQPGSMMDVRAGNIQDPDRRIRKRIARLKDSETGYLRPLSLKQNGKTVQYHINGTVLEVQLNKPILPGKEVVFKMQFEGQVPLQIRRSGRDNAEGISYSMAQWYPKLCEYDYEGWHANPYIGREFYGTWGDFDVKISIDPSFVVAATGYCQNPNEVGYGYQDEGVEVMHSSNKKLTWHFNAPNVHDFVWAADPDYKHLKKEGPNGIMLHFFYQPDSITEKTWPLLPDITVNALEFMNEHFGTYPYKKYSVIQAGDGGMEYPMATLIKGRSSMEGLVGVTVHEFFHSWYQMVLGSNESLYAWMDEGFTSYASAYTMQYIRDSKNDPLQRSYNNYYFIVKSGNEEPLSSHADHFNTNRAYSVAAYSKGAVTLGQLEYIMGKEVFDRAFRRYFSTWKFKHPNPTDFKRIMEKESGLELDWYFLDWVGTTRTIDYGIRSVISYGDKTMVTLERTGQMPMPVEVVVEYNNGDKEKYYMPLRIMRGEKQDDQAMPRKVLPDWPWTYPTYTFSIPVSGEDIKSIEIDPSKRMADINQSDNIFIIDRFMHATFD